MLSPLFENDIWGQKPPKEVIKLETESFYLVLMCGE